MARTVRAYCITAESVARERERVGGDPKNMDVSNVVHLDKLELRDVGPRDVHMRILAASAEHNIDHAATADTVNIAEARGGKMFPGNSALGEAIEVGDLVTDFQPGDIGITHSNGAPDKFGFPPPIWAYDQPDSVGWYGEAAVGGAGQLIKAPLDCGLNLWEMAALPLRAPTAYHMWRRALGIYRIKVPRERQATLNVLGFGGGGSELVLQLARSQGHNALFFSRSPQRRGPPGESGHTRPRPKGGQ